MTGVTALVAGLALATAAQALDVERLQGTIIMASEGQVAFRDAAGSQRIMTTTPDCMVTIDGRVTRLENLSNGMHAMLLVNRNGQCMHVDARTVPIGSETPRPHVY
jgi:hypothetical protein